MRSLSSAIIGMFVALALGVAIAATALLAHEANAPRVPARLAGAGLVVQSPAAADGNDAYEEHVPWTADAADDLAVRLARIEGVAQAVPDRSFYAQAVTDGRPVGGPRIGGTDPRGHAWAAHALSSHRLVEGRPPAGDDEIVVGRSVGRAPGTRLAVLTASGPRDFTVSGVTSGTDLYLADRTAARLAAGIRAIGLRLEPGTDPGAVARAASAHGTVVSGSDRAALEYPELGAVRFVATHLLVANGALAGFASIFIVAGTFALATAQRRREFALLRAVGATPGQVRRKVLGEALVIGVAAATMGCVLAVIFSPLFGNLLHEIGMLPADVSLDVRFRPLAAAFGVGLVAALMGSWSSARRASKVPALEAFREAAVDLRPMSRPRWVSGAALLLIGLAEAALTPFVETALQLITPLIAAMALLSGIALLAPVIIKPLLRPVPGVLVREHALTAIRRTAALAAPIMITVGFTTVIGGLVYTMGGPNVTPRLPDVLGTGTVVTMDETPGLSEAAVERVADRASWSAPLSTTMLYGLRGGRHYATPATAVDAAAVKRAARHLDVLSGSIADFGGPRAMVATRTAAEAHGWRTGATVPITFADGRTAAMRVVAVAGTDALPARVLITRDALRAHDPAALADGIHVDGTPPSELEPVLTGLGATAMSATDFVDASDAEERRQIWMVITIMIVLSVGYTGVSIVSTLAMSTAARRRDLAVLRLAGATSGQVARMLSLETTLVAGVGTAFGLAVAVPTLLGVHAAMTSGNDLPVPLIIPWPLVGGVIVTALALALAAALIPARRKDR